MKINTRALGGLCFVLGTLPGHCVWPRPPDSTYCPVCPPQGMSYRQDKLTNIASCFAALLDPETYLQTKQGHSDKKYPNGLCARSVSLLREPMSLLVPQKNISAIDILSITISLLISCKEFQDFSSQVDRIWESDTWTSIDTRHDPEALLYQSVAENGSAELLAKMALVLSQKIKTKTGIDLTIYECVPPEDAITQKHNSRQWFFNMFYAPRDLV